METGDPDIWVCAQCRSVNKLRAKQCYNCRTPKDLAAVDPSDIQGTGHGALREIALPEFHASRGEAMLASLLIILVAGMNVVSTIVTARLLASLIDDPEPALSEITAAATVSLATLGVAVLALTAWAYWLSRVVVAMPALGLGYPAANGLMAFVENFLPGLNLFRVPAIVRDVVRRIEPGSGRGEALIFAAWIGLLGGFVVPRVGAFFGYGDTLDTAVSNALLIQGVATGLVLVGAIFLVALIWWIEARIARRRVIQLAGNAPQVAVPQGDAPQGQAPQVAAVAADPHLATPAETPIPYDPRAAPFAPARQTAPTPEPTTPAAPFAPTPGAAMPAGEATVAGPLGAVPAAPTAGDFLHRPITSVTGTGSALPPEDAARAAPAPAAQMPASEAPDVERFADARPAWGDEPAVEPAPAVDAAHTVDAAAPVDAAPPSEPPPTFPAAPAAEPPPAFQAAPAAEPPPAAPNAPLAHVPTGPRLYLRVEGAKSMIATLDGESETISLNELRAAAAALARADGSAVIEASSTSFQARALAQQAFEVLSAARVPTTMEG